MITLLSPAKSLDYDSPDTILEKSIPQFTTQTNQLIRILKKKSVNEIKELMHVSDKLAVLNQTRYKNFKREYTDENSKSAILAFDGDVYTGLDASSMETDELVFANRHIRILSGLYGILRPLDLMQPYRLEMGTRLENKKGSNLYHFWGDQISKSLNKDLAKLKSDTVLNLASNEYFKSVDKKKLKAKIIDVTFKEEKDGVLKFVSFFAKKARGLMARYVIDHRVVTTSDLRGFDYDGYRYQEELSTADAMVFVR